MLSHLLDDLKMNDTIPYQVIPYPEHESLDDIHDHLLQVLSVGIVEGDSCQQKAKGPNHTGKNNRGPGSVARERVDALGEQGGYWII